MYYYYDVIMSDSVWIFMERVCVYMTPLTNFKCSRGNGSRVVDVCIMYYVLCYVSKKPLI